VSEFCSDKFTTNRPFGEHTVDCRSND